MTRAPLAPHEHPCTNAISFTLYTMPWKDVDRIGKKLIKCLRYTANTVAEASEVMAAYQTGDLSVDDICEMYGLNSTLVKSDEWSSDDAMLKP